MTNPPIWQVLRSTIEEGACAKCGHPLRRFTTGRVLCISCGAEGSEAETGEDAGGDPGIIRKARIPRKP